MCSFLTTWNKTLVITIAKPGKDPTFPKWYRPLLSSQSKLLKKIILAKLNNNIVCKIRQEQAAFHRDNSTIQQLVNLGKISIKNLNNKIHTASTFLDIENVFDRV